MLDPPTAFGLAVNIIQFLDLGGQIIRTGYRAYQSHEGASEASIHLSRITEDLVQVTGKLSQPLEPDGATISKPDANLANLARQCHELAQRLLDIMSALKVKSKGASRGWNALQIAVKETITKRSEISSISNLLNDYRQQISTHLLALLSNDQSTVLKELHNLQNSLRLQAEEIAKLKRLKTELIDKLSSHKTLVDRPQIWKKLVREDNESERERERVLLVQIVGQMQILSQKTSTMSTEDYILDSLDDPQMHMRHEAIKATYPNTFGWIFEEESTEFKSWLEHGSGIFWIRGKAGSGKSVLMKFLGDHANTKTILQSWAGSKRLVVASHYFWSAGMPLQKSQRGLLQGLLFQLLMQCPELIPVAVPHRWNATERSHRNSLPWERHELSEALANILAVKFPVRFCFFIDGLDEYSGDFYDLAKGDQLARAEADHFELIKDLENLAQSPDVKLCVSSRPWNPFVKAFGNGKCNTLILEQLTQNDIANYITGILEEDPRFVELASRDLRASELVVEIREKAEGVFLWVFLAVRSLLRGLSEDDDIEELKRRARRLPSDLREFFLRILHSIDKQYQDLTCRLLALATYSAPLPLMAFWYLNIELDDPNYALNANIEPLRPSYVNKIKASATTSVNKWCRDLLEVQQLHGVGFNETFEDEAGFQAHAIVFLHRTVKDFLSDSDIRQYIEQRVGRDFSEPLSMCRLHLAQAKSRRPGRKRDLGNDNRFHYLAREIMHHAKEYELRYSAPATAIIDELDRVGDEFAGSHWPDYIPVSQGCSRVRNLGNRQGQSNCLALAVSYDLYQFVSESLDRNPEAIQKPGRPMIAYAIYPTLFHPRGNIVRPHISTSMIHRLLWAGADVNARTETPSNTSIWQLLLYECYYYNPKYPSPGLEETVIAFINSGADLDCLVEMTHQDSTVLECLTVFFSEDVANKLLADARRSRAVPGKLQTPTWTSWLMRWR